MDSGPMVGMWDSTKDSPEAHSFVLQVRPVRVVVFLSPAQLHRCRCGAGWTLDLTRAGVSPRKYEEANEVRELGVCTGGIILSFIVAPGPTLKLLPLLGPESPPPVPCCES